MLVEHVRTMSHEIDFSNRRVIASIVHKTRRIIRLPIEIEGRPNNLNTRDGTQRLPSRWKPALSGLTKKTSNRQREGAEAAAETVKRNTRQVYIPSSVATEISSSRVRRNRAAARSAARGPEDGMWDRAETSSIPWFRERTSDNAEAIPETYSNIQRPRKPEAEHIYI